MQTWCAAVMLMWLAACGAAPPCANNAGCATGERCVEGLCEPAPLVPTRPDGGTDGGTDGGVDGGACTPGVECRARSGDCDVAEVCSADGVCPPDGWVGSGVMCREAEGPCDLEERCSGLSPLCPFNAVRDAQTVCRAAVSGCDVSETCTGVDADCPADRFAPATLQCAAQQCADGATSPARYCSGSAAACAPSTEVSCNGYQCDGATCATTCASNADCRPSHWCQPGHQCAPRKPDGASCSGPGSTDECASGVCSAVFVDADADGFGAGAAVGRCGALPPEGHATQGGDCCDLDPWAKPGASSFRAVPRAGCGGYDYDCNGVETREHTATDACQDTGACSTEDRACSGTTGWAGPSVPGCGQSASLVTLCERRRACSTFTCPDCDVCLAHAAMVTQACR